LTRRPAHSLTTMATTHPSMNLRYIIYLGVLCHVWSQKQETNMTDRMDRGNNKVTQVTIYDYTLIHMGNECQNN